MSTLWAVDFEAGARLVDRDSSSSLSGLCASLALTVSDWTEAGSPSDSCVSRVDDDGEKFDEADGPSESVNVLLITGKVL
ncbi:hypothetical protein PIIN_11258 [Serendipita indica DSM 11827]|uniref:Uncharacterized protein n=1 Tax=Serendipita indica (strain DSM 11827) TaxID=1109443 RepID=G4U137_SERID|nr:hypothetical protein PIIN_11258 [Serendipita indica DSM 11827]